MGQEQEGRLYRSVEDVIDAVNTEFLARVRLCMVDVRAELRSPAVAAEVADGYWDSDAVWRYVADWWFLLDLSEPPDEEPTPELALGAVPDYHLWRLTRRAGVPYEVVQVEVSARYERTARAMAEYHRGREAPGSWLADSVEVTDLGLAPHQAGGILSLRSSE